MILAERDESGAFTAAADGVLEKRRYYGQNWRSDTAMLATDTGKLVENVKYFSNGVAAEDPAGDIDGNRTWDSTDAAAITGGYDITKDVDMDGSVNSNDITQANAINGGYLTTALALGLPSQVNNRKAYAGYELEPNLLGSKFHVRNRVLDGELGRWSRRDPLGYVDGMGLYGYVGQHAISANDPFGLRSKSCGAGCAAANQPRHTSLLAPVGLCAITVLLACQSDPEVIAAYRYMQQSCSGSSSCPSGWLFICGAASETGCSDCTISIDPNRGCGTVAHELIHAGDQCQNGCPRNGYYDGMSTCTEFACSELRAVHSGCCNWKQYPHHFTSYTDCWTRYMDAYFALPPCGVAADWNLALSCCGRQESDCGTSPPSWLEVKSCLYATTNP